MSVDFSGRWAAQLRSDPFFSGIEFGMVAVRIDHVEPLLQLTVLPSAPRYAFGQLLCNLRTDGAEVVTRLGSGQVRTHAHWESDELSVEMQIALGRYAKRLTSRWGLSKDGRLLTMQHESGAERHVTVLDRQDSRGR